jgi:hypothetical protein
MVQRLWAYSVLRRVPQPVPEGYAWTSDAGYVTAPNQEEALVRAREAHEAILPPGHEIAGICLTAIPDECVLTMADHIRRASSTGEV